ncbi:eukaryotic translation initiation factor 5A-3 [Brassica napus]|uniref:eukaryotic translation initiation factor 5A-3 n=1 Tax=Brassica napus TaxID=3708 RepID=UPI0004EE6574|nr:eukaryotic translation initiation factor 5A-3 [Brassica napus]
MTTGSSHDGASRRASKIGNRKRTLRLASEIVLNDHIDIKGKPCRVLEAYTKRSLRYFYTIDILTGYIVWSIVPTSTKFVIPDVSTDIYQLIGISYKNHSVTLLHLSSDYTRNDIFLPEDRQLRNLMVNGFNDDKIVYVAVVSSLGKDAVYRVQVDDKTDSAISDVVANNVGFKE